MMNRKYLLSVLSVGLLSSAVQVHAVDPTEVLPRMTSCVLALPFGYYTFRNMQETIEDFNNKDLEKRTTLYEDIKNIAVTTGTVAGAILLGGMFLNDTRKSLLYVGACVGTGAVIGGSWLAVKHVGDNQSLRLREYASGVMAGGFFLNELAKRDCAFRFEPGVVTSASYR